MPTATASLCARRRCTYFRAASPVSHRGDAAEAGAPGPPGTPIAPAIAPSSETASFSVTHGRVAPLAVEEERRVELARGRLLDAELDFDTGRAQAFRAAA